jgi:hypothetical protein
MYSFTRGNLASIESLVRELLEILVGGETAVTMRQPRCQAHRQRFGQQPATGGLGPHLRNNRERDFGNQRILEAPLVSQGCVRRCRIDTDAQAAVRREVLRREVDMQDLRHRGGDIERAFFRTRR